MKAKYQKGTILFHFIFAMGILLSIVCGILSLYSSIREKNNAVEEKNKTLNEQTYTFINNLKSNYKAINNTSDLLIIKNQDINSIMTTKILTRLDDKLLMDYKNLLSFDKSINSTLILEKSNKNLEKFYYYFQPEKSIYSHNPDVFLENLLLTLIYKEFKNNPESNPSLNKDEAEIVTKEKIKFNLKIGKKYTFPSKNGEVSYYKANSNNINIPISTELCEHLKNECLYVVNYKTNESSN